MEQFASKFLADIVDKMKYSVEIRNPATGALYKEGELLDLSLTEPERAGQIWRTILGIKLYAKNAPHHNLTGPAGFLAEALDAVAANKYPEKRAWQELAMKIPGKLDPNWVREPVVTPNDWNVFGYPAPAR